MQEFDTRVVAEVVRRELEQTLALPPAWLVERIRDQLAHAIAKHLNDQKAHEIAASIVAAIGDELADAVADKLAGRLRRMVVTSVEQGTLNVIRPLVRELRRLDGLSRDESQDDWWRHGSNKDDHTDEH